MISIKVKGVADIGSLMKGGREQQISLPEGSSLRDMLLVLAEGSGDDFRDKIFLRDSEEARSDVRLLINGRDYIFLNRLDTKLRDQDHISILPLLGGG